MAMKDALKSIRKAIAGFFKAFQALSQLSEKLDSLNSKMEAFSQDIDVMKKGLQSELVGTLSSLYNKVMTQGWADNSDRAKAAKLHTEIDELGAIDAALKQQADGYYQQIIRAPQSLIQFMNSTSHMVK